MNLWGESPLYLNPVNVKYIDTSTSRRQGRNRQAHCPFPIAIFFLWTYDPPKNTICPRKGSLIHHNVLHRDRHVRGKRMTTPIKIIAGTITVTAELDDTPLAKTIAAKLPIETEPNEWGDEFSFGIPVRYIPGALRRRATTRGKNSSRIGAGCRLIV